MQHDITKLCADSLRAFLNNKHDIKLKSGHAHEIVAAFFGYKSKIALLADTQYPLSNLEKTKFILTHPPIPFVEQRLRNLEGLPPNLPSSVALIEGVYTPIVGEKRFLEKLWPSFRDLAAHIAEQRLYQRLKMFGIDLKAIKWDMVVDIEHNEDGVLLTVDVGYHTDTGERLKDSKYTIKLLRIAANLGYGEAKVAETRYAGNTRKRDFPEMNFPESGII